MLVGVAASGEVRFCFVQSGTGDSAMDGEAVRLVSALRLAPSGEAIIWGDATVRWGSDAVAQKP